jgi:hypothetical protein
MRWIFIPVLLLAGCDEPPPDPNPRVSVVRICRDGSFVYLRKDGTYSTSFGWPVTDIDKVCQ